MLGLPALSSLLERAREKVSISEAEFDILFVISRTATAGQRGGLCLLVCVCPRTGRAACLCPIVTTPTVYGILVMS